MTFMKTRQWCFLFGLFIFGNVLWGQGVKISSSPGQPHSSAGLEVDFTDRGLLLPRLTTTQRNAISTPTPGLEIYNITSECVEVYFSTGWRPSVCACSAPPATPAQLNLPSGGICPGQTDTFQVTPSVGASTYTWSVPSGATLVSGQGTTQAVISFPISVSGNITVVAANTCGNASPLTTPISVVNPTPSITTTPSFIGTNQNITFNANATASTYAWTFQNGTPATSSLASPVVQWSATGTYQVTVTTTNTSGCSATATANITVSPCGAVTGSQTFNYTGNVQSWTVPSCVTQATFRVWAASGGGSSTGGSGQSGRGGYTEGVLQVTPGEVYFIYVGQQGGVSSNSTPTFSAYNGGGFGNAHTTSFQAAGGGGASDIRFGGQTLADRILISGGGGGGHINYDSNRRGGVGGGLTGGNGGSNNGINAGGTGGTQSAGGVGGQYLGQSGSLGQGGNGVGDPAGGGPCCAGGGGGGYYGGAGGNHSGAGGGSSYASGHPGCLPATHSSGKIFTNTQMQQGIQHSNGQVIIQW
jgi:hypothetical protein